MKKIFSTRVLPVMIGALLLACASKEKKETQSALDDSAVAVQLSPVETVEYSLPVISSGLISTEEESRLSFKVPGIVQRIYVKEGDAVTQGQTLATLDLTEIDAQVAQAKNNVAKLHRDLERAQKLFRDSAATTEQLQNLQTAVEVAEESYRIANFNRQFSTIRATASGRVLKKFVNEGELVSAGSPVLMINSAAQNNWIVRVALPDVDWVRVKKNDKVIITLDAYAGEKFSGVVQTVNEGSDPMTGLYQTEIRVMPGNKKLASGLFANVSITPTDKQTLQRVPIEALVEGQGKSAFVFVVADDRKSVRKIQVDVAYLNAKDAFLRSGLEQVREVVTGGAGFLTENSSVTISQR